MNEGTQETPRLEIKFVAPETEYGSLLRWVRLNSLGFIQPFADRWVRSIYFDTLDNAAFTENLLGNKSRTKIRYRWYGDSPTPAAGSLEIKCKRNCFGWKVRYVVPTSPYQPGRDWMAIRRALLGQLPPEGKNLLNVNPMPVLINRYHRRYFVSSDDLVRITIDTKQAVWDQRFKPFPNLDHRANLPETLVLEVKIARKDHDLAAQILEGLPIRVSRNSKYVTGVRVISGR